jgi:hypothetical protein
MAGDHFSIDPLTGDGRMTSTPGQATDTILCCSEPLTFSNEWKLLPKDSMLICSGAVPCLHFGTSLFPDYLLLSCYPTYLGVTMIITIEVVKLTNLYRPFDDFVKDGASKVKLGLRK